MQSSYEGLNLIYRIYTNITITITLFVSKENYFLRFGYLKFISYKSAKYYMII